MVTFKKATDTRINIKVDAQGRSLKAILLLLGSPKMLYNNGIEGKDMWEEAHRLFVKKKKN